jgi:hypothetical protein
VGYQDRKPERTIAGRASTNRRAIPVPKSDNHRWYRGLRLLLQREATGANDMHRISGSGVAVHRRPGVRANVPFEAKPFAFEIRAYNPPTTIGADNEPTAFSGPPSRRAA